MDPSGWSREKKIGYLANMNRQLCRDAIHQGLLDPTDYKGTYETWLLATGNERLARKKQSDAAEAFMEQQIANGKQ